MDVRFASRLSSHLRSGRFEILLDSDRSNDSRNCDSVLEPRVRGKQIKEMSERENYHQRPEWSYSQMKLIIDSGIDYAVAAKRGMLPGPCSKAIDLGELAHMFVLGGDAEIFVVTPYSDFRTKEARDWKAEQIEAHRKPGKAGDNRSDS